MDGAVVVGGVFLSGWFGVPRLIAPTRCHALGSTWDARIPLVPEALPVYLLGYVLPMLPLFIVRDDVLFYRGVRVVCLLFLISFSVFLIYPVCLAPPADVFPPLVERYFFTTSTNCFPSLHVAMSLMVALTIWDLGHPFRWPVLLTAAAVAAGTVLLKVHFLWDVAAGLGLGTLLHLLFLRNPLRASRRLST